MSRRLARDLLVGLALTLAGLAGALWQVAASAPEGEQTVPKLICPLH
jgi:hypothetical protein